MNELLPGSVSPDVIVRAECLRHGQHNAVSTLHMRCELCHDSNRPGVIERRYVDEAEVERLEKELLDARSALGVAILVMTHEQWMQWQDKLRKMEADVG